MQIPPAPYNPMNYDEGMHRTIANLQHIYTETVDLAKNIKPDARGWLDTGCGTGNLVKLAFEKFRSTRFMIADPSQEMLMQARLKLAGIPPSQLLVVGTETTEVLDLTGFPCPQVITATLVHHYFNREGRIKATENCYEILDDDGVYITVEHILPATRKGKEIAMKRWVSHQTTHGKTEDEANTHIMRYGTAYFPITIEEHLESLKNAGFRTAELFWLSHLQAGFYAVK